MKYDAFYLYLLYSNLYQHNVKLDDLTESTQYYKQPPFPSLKIHASRGARSQWLLEGPEATLEACNSTSAPQRRLKCSLTQEQC